ncbi:universal stress protein [Desulfoglaeba alkanexedens]|uniref:Universal stress protein n=1 Tax=Desulfoglaeba alkanexedens ALDC TaxID=980445 RepID=A0A4P8L169_9BACT|nr:universal stress protein [Desulfoglaeba alkanexedens]QCQ21568.1 universal stress protein [Desulfoglaeba alkanexedens ALDC]
MEHRVLVAVDHSENAFRAVEYVGKVMRHHPEAHITLHHVILSPSPDIVPEEEKRKEQVAAMRAETLTVLERMGRRLTELGFPEKSIRLHVQVCREAKSIVDLLLHQQRAGRFGTVVVGRRGMSKREEFLFGSVSSKIIREARNCAVWVVE